MKTSTLRCALAAALIILGSLAGKLEAQSLSLDVFSPTGWGSWTDNAPGDPYYVMSGSIDWTGASIGDSLTVATSSFYLNSDPYGQMRFTISDGSHNNIIAALFPMNPIGYIWARPSMALMLRRMLRWAWTSAMPTPTALR